MRKLFLAALAVLFTSPAWAFGPSERVVRVWGEQVTFSGTNDAFDPGFTADWVSICMQQPSGGSVYFRPGKTLAEATTADVGLVTSANFKTGAAGSFPGQAFVLSASSDATEPNCVMIPWRVDGLVGHMDFPGGASGVSLDLNFFDTVTDR